MLLLFLDCHSQCVCARYWEFPVVLVSLTADLFCSDCDHSSIVMRDVTVNVNVDFEESKSESDVT